MTSARKRPSSQYCDICHSQLVPSPHDVLKTYVCANCERQKSYGTPNQIAYGQLGNLPTFSLEFEVAAPPHDSAQVRRALVLLQHGFIRTYDSTVDDEYKSPIYCSLKAFRKPLMVLDSLRDLVNERCGTHLHVGCAQHDTLYSMRQAVFEPLVEYMQAHEQQTTAFWGRFFSPYACTTLANGERHVCFNVGYRHPTIEFRLPRFRSAEQYVRLLRFCRETTAFISETLDENVVSAKRLAPEQLGERILARYQKAARVVQPPAPTIQLPTPTITIQTLWAEQDQEVRPCAD